MFIIVGRKSRLENLGPIFKRHCHNCNNEGVWSLVTYYVQVSFFFIPFFSVDVKYFLTCPVCHNGIQIFGTDINYYKEVARSSKSFMEDKISKEEYENQLGNINSKNHING